MKDLLDERAMLAVYDPQVCTYNCMLYLLIYMLVVIIILINAY